MRKNESQDYTESALVLQGCTTVACMFVFFLLNSKRGNDVGILVAFFIPMIFFFIVLAVLGLLQICIGSPYGGDSASVFKKTKRYMIIAYGGCTLAAIVSHYYSFYYGNSLSVIYPTFLCCCISCFFFHVLFARTASYDIFLNMNYHFCLVIVFILLQIGGMIYFNALLTEGYNQKQVIEAWTCRLSTVLITTPRIVDFFVVLSGKVGMCSRLEWMKEDEEEMEKKQEVTEEYIDEEDDSEEPTSVHDENLNFESLRCQICRKKYNEEKENRIPRILTECGHTVCTGCVEKLRIKGDQRKVLCPFCGYLTINDDSVNELKKNHLVIGLVQELKQAILDENARNLP